MGDSGAIQARLSVQAEAASPRMAPDVPRIVAIKSLMDRHDPGHRVALAVDEWGAWYDPEPGSSPGFQQQRSTLRDAMVAALTLNAFHRHTDRVRMTNLALMVNVLQTLVLTDGPRRCSRRPTTCSTCTGRSRARRR
jgi:alpha-L-arabinofuranosidase